MDNQVETKTVENTENSASSKTMTRGTIIQAVKAIAVLVCICLVCGALLALCNDIFFISDEERAARAEAKINASLKEVYPDLQDPITMTINKEFAVNTNYGSIQKVVKSADGAYVIAAEGIGGFGGSIVVLIAISPNAEIVAWKVSDGGGETYLADVTQHTDWYVGKEISTDIELIRHSGATYTSTALNNAIKMASYYAMNVLNLGENPEADARNAVIKLLGDDYSDYEWTTNIDAEYRTASNVTYNVSGKDVTAELSYYFVGTKAGSQDLAAYAFIVENEIQVVVTNENVIHADRVVVASSEGVNEAVVNSVVNRSYLEYTLQKIYKNFTLASVNENVAFSADNGSVSKMYVSGDGVRIFQASGTGDYGTGSGNGVMTINVAVSADNKLIGWSFVSTTTPSGSSFINDVLSDENSSNWYKDQTITSGIAMGENMTSGATMCSTAINHAIQSVGAYLEQGGSN